MLISVIIPVYNSERIIERSINSVILAMKGISYEIICIDDGSKDGSLKVLNELHEKNPNIIIVHQENSGAAAARNRGLEIAKGDFVAFNDSDDEWLPEHFDILKNAFDDNPELFCVAGNHDVEKQKTLFLKKIKGNVSCVTLKKELVKNYYSPQATMFKRDIVERGIRFKDGMRYAEEGYFFYQIVHTYPSGFINKQVSKSILGKEKFGDGGLSGNLKMMEKGELYNLKFAHIDLGIGFTYYCMMVLLSYIKYCRRIIITKFRAIK